LSRALGALMFLQSPEYLTQTIGAGSEHLQYQENLDILFDIKLRDVT
jgi:hypothetical protein